MLRRWNLDLGAPGGRAIIVALHVVMKANGTIATAEIVDKHRYATDAAYRQIALSARNAVLLVVAHPAAARKLPGRNRHDDPPRPEGCAALAREGMAERIVEEGLVNWICFTIGGINQETLRPLSQVRIV